MALVCEYLGKCGGCVGATLESKIAFASSLLSFKDFEVFKSEQSHFRGRAELGIYHDNGEIFYTMRGEKERFVKIKNCQNLLPNIQKTLPILLKIFNAKEFGAFKERLFSLEILASQNNTLLLTLIYHKKLEKSWLLDAEVLATRLKEYLGFHFEIVGRSRGVKLVLGKDYLTQTLEILGKRFYYRYNEGAFSQPNTAINAQMIAWVLKHLKGGGDLLEMYCGCGNFTIPLSFCFDKILATEISKTSINALKFACEKNKIPNIFCVRLSGAECIEALNGIREFNRLRHIDLSAFNFSSVFVDPPRCGLGVEVCEFLKRFKQIIYISCNPITLGKDLEILKKTHHIRHAAFFDQFPHTKHLECGVILEK
ncbi:tRNA (uridine(54)-C5)-methyltransferase TrmA [Helicobacter sp.]|uniref:tRNA (uridine(54)-C5)-methyltransferase TrmA n=1 Tax=Helicobacter sp. TaxID=218 RepID=UPI0025BD8397|nr:tRNA (uridine(54)-C5)-methyltransferase TrmA [Helicobacter sp.]MCI5968680.1 tRNA (uridine(54)-C5)-methyltransferase TrmA [Helicobacter sp.]MDY2584502.1 tRNA (uridine(54)-C5)-methyltransferase TrmA [Helicobacter sp.]